MSKKNVVYFADYLRDSTFWTPEQMLERVLEEIREGEGLKPNRAILLLIDDTTGEFYYTWHTANCSYGTVIRAAETFKFDILKIWSERRGDDG